MKLVKWVLIVIALLVGIYAIVVFVVPNKIEEAENSILAIPPYTVSEEAQRLYNSIDFIADLHCDALLWNRDLTKKSAVGHVDFPRMQTANMALQAFTIVTKSPAGQNFSNNSGESFDNITMLSIVQGRPISNWFSLVDRAIYQSRKLHKQASRFNDKFIVIKSKSDFELLLHKRKTDKQIIGGFLGVEGAHCLEGDIKNLDRLYKEGVRMLGPTHFFDNELGGSAHGESDEGLTEFGKQVVKRMNQLGIIIDISHASPQMVDDILEISRYPILTSHTGVKGTMDNSRNLSDKHIISIAEGGGLIGVAYFKGAVSSPLIPGIVDAMKYIKAIAGVECIALGSDYDGSVKAPFDITGLPLLVEEMIQQGFSKFEIEAIMGENMKRFMLKNLR
jgi:membrane dipeptidase